MEPKSKKLPTGVKVTGWIFLLVGAWNIIFPAVAALSGLLPPPGHDAAVSLRWFVAFSVPWACIAVLVSTGLLLKKEWGRIGTIWMIYLLMVLGLAWAVYFNVVMVPPARTTSELAFKIVGIVFSSAFLGGMLFGLYMLTRYLRSEKVRAAFTK